MMKLSQLLEQIEYTCVQGGLDKETRVLFMIQEK